MNARARGLAKASVLLGMITGFALIPGVASAGSDSPTPYTVTADGITLPADTVFPAHGHVNWRTTSSSGGIHFDPNNNQPGAVYIGASFLPITLAPGECITWVQISLYDEHYGEGGQPPVCKPTTKPEPTEEPTWTPEPTPSTTTAAPSESPTTTPEPSTPPTGHSSPPSETPTSQPQPTSEPSLPSAEPSLPTSLPNSDPTGTPTTPAPIHCDPGYAPGWLDENGNPTGCVANGPITEEPEEDTWTAPTETPTSEQPSSPNNAPTASTSTPSPTLTESAPDAPGTPLSTPSASLAATGSNDTAVGLGTALVVVALGAYLIVTRRRP